MDRGSSVLAMDPLLVVTIGGQGTSLLQPLSCWQRVLDWLDMLNDFTRGPPLHW